MQTIGKEITTIIFDLGGVLIDWNPRYLYRKIFKSEDEIEHFLSTVCTGEWNAMQDAGRAFEAGVLEKTREFPEFEPQIRAYADRWEEMLNGEITGTVKILRKLHGDGKYRLLALTNWSSETFTVARRDYELLNLFEGILVSGDEKLIKPDPKIYELLLDRYQVAPKEAVFIDDSEKNVIAARKAGMHGIHFKDPGGLEINLMKLNIRV